MGGMLINVKQGVCLFLSCVQTYKLLYLCVYHVRCQTYEGGFGGMPGVEAHGGYSFCGFAALVIMGKEDLCDLKALLVCNDI